jgi:hypothetical protein
MSAKIFYAWQSDLDVKTNRYFIKSCIEKAIKRVDSDLAEVQESPRLEIDHDTKGIPGSPAIVGAIFEKIDESIAFVGDVSFVASTKPVEGTDTKRLPNPNVLLEMGYALGVVSDKRLILVQNTYYGNGAELPFDLQHRRWPISYELAPGSVKIVQDQVKRELCDKIYHAIRAIVNMPDTFWLTEEQERLQLASEQLWGIANLLLVRLRMFMMSTPVVDQAPQSVREFFGLSGAMVPNGPGCNLVEYDRDDMNGFWHAANLAGPSNMNFGGRRLSVGDAILNALSEAKKSSEDFLSRYSALQIAVTTKVTYLHNSIENALSILQMSGPTSAAQEHPMVRVSEHMRQAIDFVMKARQEYRREL